MGEFRAGTWLIGLFLYFFLFTTILFASIEAGDEFGLDTVGYNSDYDGYAAENDDTIVCQGVTSNRCQSTDADDNETCSLIDGCTWTSGVPDYCGGTHNITDCRTITDVDICTLLSDCEYVGYEVPTIVSPTKSYSMKAISTTFGTMYSINPIFGLPLVLSNLFRVIFILIPTLMVLFALYMAAPFIH